MMLWLIISEYRILYNCDKIKKFNIDEHNWNKIKNDSVMHNSLQSEF